MPRIRDGFAECRRYKSLKEVLEGFVEYVMRLWERYIGDKQFYYRILRIAIPIMVQNAFSNLVGLLDNLMIGRLGTNALSGVAIANQLIFIFYLLIFGSVAGAGIFTAQYYGMKDEEGVRNTFRFKILLVSAVTIIGIAVFATGSDWMIGQFLKGEGSANDAMETLRIGKGYMSIMLIGLFPNAISQAFASTLRETGETKLPMKAVVASVLVNLVGNFLLIYGYFGFPRLGAQGAAMATVLSRLVELAILVIFTYIRREKHTFVNGAFRHILVSRELAGRFFMKCLPLMANETLWAVGIAFMNQCYSYRSLNAVAANNIQQTLWNFLGVAFLAMGDGVGIITGHTLGSGDFDKAKKDSVKLIAFTCFGGAVFGALEVLISSYFPMLYNTSDAVRRMASQFIVISGLLMPLYAYTHATYFTIRAGGRVFITMLFDSCFVWLISVPVAYVLSRYTVIDIVKMYLFVQCLEIIKCIIGGTMVHKGIWIRKIVGDSN